MTPSLPPTTIHTQPFADGRPPTVQELQIAIKVFERAAMATQYELRAAVRVFDQARRYLNRLAET